jgi:hypothetical protein
MLQKRSQIRDARFRERSRNRQRGGEGRETRQRGGGIEIPAAPGRGESSRGRAVMQRVGEG